MLKEISINYINSVYKTEEEREFMKQRCEEFCKNVKEIISMPNYQQTPDSISLVIDLMLLQLKHKIDTEVMDTNIKERMLNIHDTLHTVACNELIGV